MATIQDNRTLELNICEAVEEYLDAPDTHDNHRLHVFLNKNRMDYHAELDEDINRTEDDGVYSIEELVRKGEDGPEVDNERVSKLANSWLFLDNVVSIANPKKVINVMRTQQTHRQRKYAAIGIGLPLDAAYVLPF